MPPMPLPLRMDLVEVEILNKDKGRRVYKNNSTISQLYYDDTMLMPTMLMPTMPMPPMPNANDADDADDANDADADADATEDPVIFDMGPTINNSTTSQLGSASCQFNDLDTGTTMSILMELLRGRRNGWMVIATSAGEAVKDEPIAPEVVCMFIAQTPQVEED